MRPEDHFVERLRALLPRSPAVRVGIGDDAAVLEGGPGPRVATTDLLVEGVDFLPGEDPERLGRRAAAVNLSDLAAMGAVPEFFLLGVAFPKKLTADYPLAIARGVQAVASAHGASLVGGDLSDARQTVVSIALWGRLEGPALERSGARPGDHVWISGWPGRAAAGLRLARDEADGRTPRLDPGAARELLAAYREPSPRVALGRSLAAESLAHAAIDVSDGLGVDAGRLGRASGVRLVLERAKLPLAPALAAWAKAEGEDPLALTIAGGDDYELLFAAPPEAEATLAAGRAAWEVPLRRIGACEAGTGAVLRDGAADRDVSGEGYDHLAGAG